MINRWWEADPAEIFWMEITGRNDLGANLAAPQTDERGAEYVGYTLVREVRDGDVVFHFDRKLRQIVAWSRALGGPYTGTIIWAARGTSFRQHGGGKAYERPGWFFNLEGPYPLDEPVTLAWLRGHNHPTRRAHHPDSRPPGHVVTIPLRSLSPTSGRSGRHRPTW